MLNDTDKKFAAESFQAHHLGTEKIALCLLLSELVGREPEKIRDALLACQKDVQTFLYDLHPVGRQDR